MPSVQNVEAEIWHKRYNIYWYKADFQYNELTGKKEQFIKSFCWALQAHEAPKVEDYPCWLGRDSHKQIQLEVRIYSAGLW